MGVKERREREKSETRDKILDAARGRGIWAARRRLGRPLRSLRAAPCSASVRLYRKASMLVQFD